MSGRLFKTGKVRERYGNCATNTIKAKVRDGLLPPPLKLSTTERAWPEAELDEVDAAIAAGATQDEQRAVVQLLMERRQAKANVLREVRQMQGEGKPPQSVSGLAQAA